MILLLASLAIAGDLPDAPKFERTAVSGCRDAIGIDPGDPIPSQVFADGQAICSYVMLPVDVHADLMLWRTHATEVRALYKIETTELRTTLTEGFEWRDNRILELEKPPPLFERAGTQRAIGALEATAAVVLGIVVVNNANKL